MIIKWTENRVKVIDKLILLPGNNDIFSDLETEGEKKKAWEKLKTDFGLQPDIDSGRIIEVSAKEKVEGKESTDFQKFSNEEKIDIINNTYNIKTLKALRKKATETDIRNLIDDQVKAIKEHKIETPADKPGSHV